MTAARRRNIWLSFSALTQYEKCPQHYRWSRWDKRDPPVQDSKHNALFGIVIQKIFELFYNDKIWKMKKETLQYLLDLSEEVFDECLENEYVDFGDPTCRFTESDVRDLVYETIPKVLKGIKDNELYGPVMISEMDIKADFGGEGDKILGYLDFVIQRRDGKVLLIDGKSTKKPETNVDPDQLYYYAYLYYLERGSWPDALGFFFYRFADEPEKAMHWLDASPETLVRKSRELHRRITKMMQAVRAGEFAANPQPKNCRYCPYEMVCTPRKKQRMANAAKRKKTKSFEDEWGASQNDDGFFTMD